jgi:hypothetical protein
MQEREEGNARGAELVRMHSLTYLAGSARARSAQRMSVAGMVDVLFKRETRERTRFGIQDGLQVQRSGPPLDFPGVGWMDMRRATGVHP